MEHHPCCSTVWANLFHPNSTPDQPQKASVFFLQRYPCNHKPHNQRSAINGHPPPSQQCPARHSVFSLRLSSLPGRLELLRSNQSESQTYASDRNHHRPFALSRARPSPTPAHLATLALGRYHCPAGSAPLARRLALATRPTLSRYPCHSIRHSSAQQSTHHNYSPAALSHRQQPTCQLGFSHSCHAHPRWSLCRRHAHAAHGGYLARRTVYPRHC